MAVWFFGAVGIVADGSTNTSDAARAGHAVGAGIGLTFLLVIWALGAVVTGLLAILTRGSKTIITETVS